MPENSTDIYNEFLSFKSHREEIWDGIAKKASAYVRGDQWTAQEKAQLASQHRAPVVNNFVLPDVDVILGHFLKNRTDLVATPFDEYADVEIAEIVTSAIKNVENINRIHDQDKRQFYKGIISGIGVKEMWFDTDEDIKGVIRVQYKPSEDFYLDPNARQYDQSDARKMFRTLWLARDEIKKVYGKKWADQIAIPLERIDENIPVNQVTPNWAGDSNDYGNLAEDDKTYRDGINKGYDSKNKLYRIIECYERRWGEKEFIYDPIKEELMDLEDYSEEIREIVQNNVIRRAIPHIHLTTIGTTGIKIEDGDTGATDFNQLFNFFFPYWDDGKYMGIVENLFSPQEERNYRHATAIHILSAIAQIGFMYEAGAIKEEDKADLPEKITKQGFTLEVEDGALSGNKIKPFTRSDMSLISAFLNMEKSEEYSAKVTSGAKDAIAGLNEKVMSGRAKMHETEQAAVQLTGVLDNFKESKYLGTKAILWWIQNYYTEERFIRITGKNEAPNTTNEQLIINQRIFGKIANDITIGTYDLVLEHEGRTTSEREREKFQLIELMRGLPPQYQLIMTKYLLMLYGFSFAKEIQIEFEQAQALEAQQQQMANAPIPGNTSATVPRPARGVRRTPQAMQV